MWKITIQDPDGQSTISDLKVGVNTVGRVPENDIVINDNAASRQHAEFIYEAETDKLSVHDLNSSNGTYLNRKRVQEIVEIQPKDTIRIGRCMITFTYYDTASAEQTTAPMVKPITHELRLETMDRQAGLMVVAARQLNKVMDMDQALREVSHLMQHFMQADKCEVILVEQFNKLHDLGFPESIAKNAIEQRNAVLIQDMGALGRQEIKKSAILYHIHSALCVPVIDSEEKVLGLIYMYKTSPDSTPFDTPNLQMAVVISHLAALTIQRARLIETVRKEQQMKNLLRRFLSPEEAEFLFKNYLESGSLPEMEETIATVLFVDIADSTSLAERIGPRRFGDILTRLYQDSSDIIFQRSGLIKFLGDGIMAVFRPSDSKVTPEERAVRAGLEIVSRVGVMNLDYPSVPVIVGVGINTGSVVAGYLGGEERIEYTVLGDTVNVAARLQNYARPNRVVIGPATVASIVGLFDTERIGEVQVKGREKALQIYEVLQPR